MKSMNFCIKLQGSAISLPENLIEVLIQWQCSMEPLPTSVQHQQDQQQFAHFQAYLSDNFELVRQSSPLYTRLVNVGIWVLLGSAIAGATFYKDDVGATIATQVQPLRTLAGGLFPTIRVAGTR